MTLWDRSLSGIKVPGGLSWNMILRSSDGTDFYERPSQVNAVFQFYHIMVAIGMALIFLTLYASFMWWKGRLFDKKWLLWIFVFSVFLPQIANHKMI